ncbi:unnamed protein product [Cylindrotheca closterium]|uniref:COP9 signalosome complex subunit 3 N-terminal helical repeats domain-containing protein n=1 Tax=Cylindrotheca closterium TaxID=2856 RepID=A0AAD2FJZ6_9STRA|nr:unnamed protein product [Cylindrotheca closterium]
MADHLAEIAADAAYRISSSSNLVLPPEFVQDPSSFLTMIASEPPSHEALRKLAGPVASWLSNPNSAEAASQVSSLYLKAAATQLKVETTSDGATVAAARKAARSGRMEEMEMLHIQHKAEVVDAVGVAAAHCMSNRISISSSGIIPSLAQIMLNAPNELLSASVEFLQCSLLAEQYRYAARLLQGTWPRPGEGSSVKQVLRYYHLRGMIHLGCNDLVMAHRCFWTCLSIPSDSLSKITFEAWKKMVLVQCLTAKQPQAKGMMRTPKSMPSVLVKLLSSYKDGSPASQTKPARAVGSESAGERRPSQRLSSQRLDQLTAQEALSSYMSLVDAFGQRDKAKFMSIMQEKEAMFTEDRNMGLVHQCLSQLVRNQVVHLSNIYSVVPVSKVVSILGLENESQVPTILLESKVPCQIQPDGMVVFDDNIVAEKNPSLVDFAEWMELLEKVQQLDISMLTSAKYHALLQKENANRKDAPGVGGPQGVEDL